MGANCFLSLLPSPRPPTLAPTPPTLSERGPCLLHCRRVSVAVLARLADQASERHLVKPRILLMLLLLRRRHVRVLRVEAWLAAGPGLVLGLELGQLVRLIRP